MDLSTGYYAITDALLVPSRQLPRWGRPTRLPGVDRRNTGAGTGQTALRRGASATRSDSRPSWSVLAALAAGQIEAAVLPIPDALRAAAADQTVTVVGQLPTGRWQPDQFHIVLAAEFAADAVRERGGRPDAHRGHPGPTHRAVDHPLAPELD